ncbi:helix-turn-helix domain-containing protein [Mammaliicoccus lentus]|uniref:helix-turn-helix domain-containing protein n=1 Tax=Mammaliicoccus lentus TaxID=42858 RepID=UPI00107180F4|nr:helix-turn-helix transcriptional regulator [Mammaliicoccus lentus]MBF0795261.1 helix-turn-helix transcriptional regulator [Mammaliicoccus lentus]TFV14657.1 XRE family transcriptional regulator [Mammaliicoccus lentus]
MEKINAHEFMVCMGKEFRKEKFAQKKHSAVLGQGMGKSARYLTQFEIGFNDKISIYRLKLLANQLNIPLHIFIKRAFNSYNNKLSEIENDETIDASIKINEKDVEQFVYNIGHVLRDIREEIGTTQTALAKQLKITRQMYHGYENMRRIQVSLYKLIEITNILDISVYEVIYQAEKRLYEDLESRN